MDLQGRFKQFIFNPDLGMRLLRSLVWKRLKVTAGAAMQPSAERSLRMCQAHFPPPISSGLTTVVTVTYSQNIQKDKDAFLLKKVIF